MNLFLAGLMFVGWMGSDATAAERAFERIDCHSSSQMVYLNLILDPTSFDSTYFDVLDANYRQGFEEARMICEGDYGNGIGYNCVGLVSGEQLRTAHVSVSGSGEIKAVIHTRRGEMKVACTRKPCRLSLSQDRPWRNPACTAEE